jgi:hypothetical protein
VRTAGQGQGYAGAVPPAPPAPSAARHAGRAEAGFALLIAFAVVSSLIVRVGEGETPLALLLALPALAAIRSSYVKHLPEIAELSDIGVC